MKEEKAAFPIDSTALIRAIRKAGVQGPLGMAIANANMLCKDILKATSKKDFKLIKHNTHAVMKSIRDWLIEQEPKAQCYLCKYDKTLLCDSCGAKEIKPDEEERT